MNNKNHSWILFIYGNLIKSRKLNYREIGKYSNFRKIRRKKYRIKWYFWE